MAQETRRPWLRRDEQGTFHVDPAVAYPIILEALGAKKVDQYWLEVAYQCAKMKVQDLAEPMGHDPSKTIRISIDGGEENKKAWALSGFPAGRGAAAATRGREAKAHYDRIREKI